MVTPAKKNQLKFYLNGKPKTVNNPNPQEPLIEYLRRTGLTGTKLGCGEGGCGSCTVVVSSYDVVTRRIVHASMNSCLAPLVSVEGKHIITVEGLGNVEHPHPIQEALATAHGSQCGYCTPGIVMSLYGLLKAHPDVSECHIEDAFDGNLCRCTGYRPIVEGAKSLARKKCSQACAVNGSCQSENLCEDYSHANGNGAGGQNGYAALSDIEDLSSAASSLTVANGSASHDLPFPAALIKQFTVEGYPSSYVFDDGTTKWYHPCTLDEILDILDEYPAAKIINGNTEVGIETRFRAWKYPVQIYPNSIPEMRTITESTDGITIGAAVQLAAFQTYLQSQLSILPSYKTQGFKCVIDNLKYFAGNQIRNVAAIGGNIVTASPISDLNSVLLALGAVLQFASKKSGVRNLSISEFFLAYRKTALHPGELLVSVFVPYTKATEYACGFKQARRRDDDIAIVNAGLRIEIDPTNLTVKDAAFGFGGMAPTPVLAKKASTLARGAKWNSKLVHDIQAALIEDMPLTFTTPGGQVEFRKLLAVSFLTKFEIYVNRELKERHPTISIHVDEREASATREILRPLSCGRQDYETSGPEHVVGNNQMHLSALKQTTGEAVYIDDMPSFGGELHAAPVISTIAHGHILTVDTSVALQAEGVEGYFDAKDIPGYRDGMLAEHPLSHTAYVNPNPNVLGSVFKDEELFATKTVFHYGQLIGIIVADNEAHARAAARLVKVTYEKWPHIITIEEAIDAKSFFPTERHITYGSYAGNKPDILMSAATHFVEGTVRCGAQEHFYLETQCSVVVPKREDGEFEVYASTQNPSETQHLLAHVMGIQANKVVVRVKRLGGGFGGKETRSHFLTCALGVAARKLGVPVRCMLTREEDMSMTGMRHPFLGKYKAGFTDAGKLVYLETDLFSNGGFSADLSTTIMERAITHSDSVYNIPNLKVTGRICKTNLVTNTAFRGFGGPQGLLVAETMITHVANYLKRPVDEIRKLNFYQNGDTVPFNQRLLNFYLDKVWQQLLQISNYASRYETVQAFNSQNKYRKKGIVLLPTKFGIAFAAKFLNQGAGLVHIYTDGSVLVTHGGTEMGQGLHTKMVQIVCENLHVPLEYVHLDETSTRTVINTSATAASMSSDINGAALLDACNQLNARLQPYRAAHPAKTWPEIIAMAYYDRVSLTAHGFFKVPEVGYDMCTNRGMLYRYFTYGAACCEVEIDTLTGDHVALRADVVMDIGRSINPAIDIGQIEGAFVQGQGWSTLEEVVHSPATGQLITRGPGAYKIPGFRDVPAEFNISIMKNSPNPMAVHSSKAVGEPPLFMGASVYFAIREAIKAARVENGLGDDWFRLDAPATSERIRLACGSSQKITRLCKTVGAPGEKSWAVTS
ncbi:xanthine dehydrogenase [Synchytrium endobioticum]|uniref:xanthine dehydrogenase n=1 Tax=Synchytrium endobioticum TaxID=286115 RepID=A0A507CVT4_9FUNG|nr:xanthine dehydrogenase [Synchytrium endobioticum]